MIIEFIGCTGAGKTTLIKEIQQRLANKAEVTTSFDLVAAPLGLGGITHPTARNLIKEFVGLPFFIRSLPRHQEFVIFALRMLARQANLSLSTISNLRSLERKLGVYEIIKRYDRKRFILVDEGPVLFAHNVFVFTSALYTPEEIARFASLVPLPDIIVYVRVPLDSLIRRALQRTDYRREIESINRAQIKKYIERTISMFEQLVEVEEIRSRILIVENPDSVGKNHLTAVDIITDFIVGNGSNDHLNRSNRVFSFSADLPEHTRHVI